MTTLACPSRSSACGRLSASVIISRRTGRPTTTSPPTPSPDPAGTDQRHWPVCCEQPSLTSPELVDQSPENLPARQKPWWWAGMACPPSSLPAVARLFLGRTVGVRRCPTPAAKRFEGQRQSVAFHFPP